jgi:hypothetical protein
MVAAQKKEETFTIAPHARCDATGLACGLAASRLDRRRLLGERRRQFVAPRSPSKSAQQLAGSLGAGRPSEQRMPDHLREEHT